VNKDFIKWVYLNKEGIYKYISEIKHVDIMI